MQDNKKRSVKTEIHTDDNGSEGTNVNIDINSDSEIPGTTHLPDPLTDQDELTRCKEEIESAKDKYVRLFAEFDNYKRRTAKERGELIQTAGKDVIVSLLDVLDDVDRAEKQLATTDNIDQVREGVKLVFNKLRNTLQSKGLKAMESLDTAFDVEKHEAITEIAVPDENKKEKVVDEIVKGYYLNDKLIRFAKVVVGK